MLTEDATCTRLGRAWSWNAVHAMFLGSHLKLEAPSVLIVITVALIVSNMQGDGPPVVFTVLSVAALLWDGYWFLFRIVRDLALTGAYLRSQAQLRSGIEDIYEVTEPLPSHFGYWFEGCGVADGAGWRHPNEPPWLPCARFLRPPVREQPRQTSQVHPPRHDLTMRPS
jgi:hypothetical protein